MKKGTNNKANELVIDLTKVINTNELAKEFLLSYGMIINPKHDASQNKERANRKRLNVLTKQNARIEREAKKELLKAERTERKIELLAEKTEFVNEYLSINEIFSSLKRKSKLFGKQLVDLKAIKSTEDAIASKLIQPYHVLGLVKDVNAIFSLVFNGGKFSPSKVYDLASKAINLNEGERALIYERGEKISKLLIALKLEQITLIEGLNILHPMTNHTKEVDKRTVTRLNASTCKKLLGLDVDFIKEIEMQEIIDLSILVSENNTVAKAKEINARKKELEKIENAKKAELEIEKFNGLGA